MNTKVQQYLNKQGKMQKLIIKRLRELIITNFPKLKETPMPEGLWYEGKFYLTSFKDHVNLGVGVMGLKEEELIHFEGKGKSMRHMKFCSEKDIDNKNLLKLMKVIYSKSKCACQINWKS